MAWYMRQLFGPKPIAYECGWGQALLKAMTDGLALFYLTPDWRSHFIEEEIPKMKGKLKLMPMPAWKPGGRRTSVWGGTGVTISKFTEHPDLAWELAKFLYFGKEDLASRFRETYILPSLKEAWTLPAFKQPVPYYSNQRIGEMYAELADDTPPVYSSPFYRVAQTKMDEAFTRAADHYRAHGERNLEQVIRRELQRSAAYIRRMQARNELLAEGSSP